MVAGDAFALVDVDELLWLYCLRQPGRVDFLQDIVVAELGKRRVGVEDTH